MKLGELFERCISLQPAAPEPAPAPQPDPLEKLPDFNVYSYDAPEKKDPGAQQTSGPDSPRGRRGSTESGVSVASSGAAKRQMKIQEAVAGNGRFEQFAGRNLALVDQLGQPEGIVGIEDVIHRVRIPRQAGGCGKRKSAGKGFPSGRLHFT